MKKLLAIGLIWLGCAIAWSVLGATLVARTDQSTSELRRGVVDLWGEPLVQRPPRASHGHGTPVAREGGASMNRPEPSETETQDEAARWPWTLTASDLEADIELTHRRKGLLWFPTYEVSFRGQYTFEQPLESARTVWVRFPIQADDVADLHVTDAEGRELEVRVGEDDILWSETVEPGTTPTWTIRYRTRGLRSWRYAPGSPDGGLVEVERFALTIRTNTADVDFPEGTLSPTKHSATDDGWVGHWHFQRLVTRSSMGVELPQLLNPGPTAARITFFAPVSLLFFFFVLAMLSFLSKEPLHPMHYFFLGCSFFAFHLLFAYLVDHLHVGLSFAISALVSMALVLTYVRRLRGWRFAARKAAVPQLLYLVLFSFTFFFEGLTGLTIAIGAVGTLFVVMQLTAKLDWDEVLGSKKEPPPKPHPYRCPGAGDPRSP